LVAKTVLFGTFKEKVMDIHTPGNTGGVRYALEGRFIGFL
jgi:TolB-like protein